jgi:hypothetical protein
MKKGEHNKFIHGHHIKLSPALLSGKGKNGSLNPNWKGGKYESLGYLHVRIDSKRKHRNGYSLEHINIVENAIRKSLPEKAVIHHANGDKSDNRNENLVVCEDAAYHNMIHARKRALKECGHANWIKCPFCKKYDSKGNMYLYPSKTRGHHRDCINKYSRERRRFLSELPAEAGKGWSR